jgi:hypothetical protein
MNSGQTTTYFNTTFLMIEHGKMQRTGVLIKVNPDSHRAYQTQNLSEIIVTCLLLEISGILSAAHSQPAPLSSSIYYKDVLHTSLVNYLFANKDSPICMTQL